MSHPSLGAVNHLLGGGELGVVGFEKLREAPSPSVISQLLVISIFLMLKSLVRLSHANSQSLDSISSSENEKN